MPRSPYVQIVSFVLGASLAGGCATDDGALEELTFRRVDVDVQKKTDEATRQSSHKPEPVYSTSFAIRLAELALQERGCKAAGRDVAVSFCDGVYRVVFARPENQIGAKDYVVEIVADNSQIIKVETGR